MRGFIDVVLGDGGEAAEDDIREERVDRIDGYWLDSLRAFVSTTEHALQVKCL